MAQQQPVIVHFRGQGFILPWPYGQVWAIKQCLNALHEFVGHHGEEVEAEINDNRFDLVGPQGLIVRPGVWPTGIQAGCIVHLVLWIDRTPVPVFQPLVNNPGVDALGPAPDAAGVAAGNHDEQEADSQDGSPGPGPDPGQDPGPDCGQGFSQKLLARHLQCLRFFSGQIRLRDLVLNLRRMVLDAVDGVSSDELRNQLAGHLDSRTYRMHYHDQHINIDVANLVKNQPTEDALTRKATSMGVNRDPRANVALPADFDEQIAALPDMVALEAESKKLLQNLRQKYGFMSQAPDSDPLMQKRKDIDRQRRRKKEAYRAQKKAELRKEYFVQKDLAIVEAQLLGDDIMHVDEPTQEAPPELIPERARLVELMDVKDSRSPTSRSEVVQAMVELCSRVVKTCRHGQKRVSASTAHRPGHGQSQEGPSHPMLCHPLQCLFCLGDDQLFRPHQIKKYNRQAALWNHAKGHLDAIEMSRDFRCPHPLCRTADVTLESVEHLLNHAQTKHGIRLRCR